MQQVKDLVSEILAEGEWRENRTSQMTLGLFGRYLRFDIRKGFPLVTLKRVPFKSVMAELCGFIKGYTNAKQFEELGTTIWNANAQSDYWLANPNNLGNGDLGRIYGAQWVDWRGSDYDYSLSGINQLQNLVDGLTKDPYGRRHIVTAWNPAELDDMALPPCHILFQCYVSMDGHMDLMMYQRSCDVFLGLPFNIASYAALLTYLAALTNYKPRNLVMALGDVHLYENQVALAREMVQREPMPLCCVEVETTQGQSLSDVMPEHFKLFGYESHPALSVPMVV
jgi:thymidylate synthase